jgi:hypothetical protein
MVPMMFPHESLRLFEKDRHKFKSHRRQPPTAPAVRPRVSAATPPARPSTATRLCHSLLLSVQTRPLTVRPPL